MQENPKIDWATDRVITEKNGTVYTLPCYHQCLNNLEDQERLTTKEINFIRAKVAQKRIQQGASDDRVFLGLIRKVDEGIEDDAINGPFDLEKLRRPDLPSVIWEVWETYSDVFLSELPKGVPPVRMGHEFKIDLEDETPPIHKPLYKLSPLELTEAKNHIQEMLEHECIRPSDSPYGPVLFIPKKDGNLRFCIDLEGCTRT